MGRDRVLGESRHHKGGRMYGGGVVLELRQQGRRRLARQATQHGVGRGGAQEEPDLPRRAVGDERQVEPDALPLVAHNGPGAHRLPQARVEGGGEEGLGRADGVARVDDDHVVRILLVLDVLGGVSVNERDARVVEGCGRALAQEILRHVADERVDLAHGNGLHALMLADLTQHAAVATTDNQNRCRVRVRVHR
eukprot:scaffold28112_cov112-Isochrysis_galbana.AAC.6